ncbi:MAG TPA: TonB family protein [Pyrinomonadaceae bacterium]|jgi:protein TonB|nr:TonB family protein [Pyrinomonadaceae bacterium]
MFTNLVESNADRSAFKRRTSFFFATVAAYALVLSAAGVVGVLTYDARVEAQNRDLLLDYWIPPVKPVTPEGPRPSQPVHRHVASKAPVDQHIEIPERIAQVPPVDDLRVTPQEIGVTGPTSPPVEGQVNITGRNANPPDSSTERDGCPTCSGPTTPQVVTPQPTPEPTPVKPAGPQRLPSTVLISKIINLPKPAYPIFAKQMGAQGPVNVQILVDESGNVISAHAVNGHPTLIHAAEDAAKRARFTPTLLNNQPVKVQGVITYNFVLQ